MSGLTGSAALASWVMLTEARAVPDNTITVALRSLRALFGATVTSTVPLVERVPSFAIVTHDSVHTASHSDAELTVNVFEPPVASKARLTGFVCTDEGVLPPPLSSSPPHDAKPIGRIAARRYVRVCFNMIVRVGIALVRI